MPDRWKWYGCVLAHQRKALFGGEGVLKIEKTEGCSVVYV